MQLNINFASEIIKVKSNTARIYQTRAANYAYRFLAIASLYLEMSQGLTMLYWLMTLVK